MAKNKKLETGIGGKKTGYEEDLKAAQNLVAAKQKIVDKLKEEAKEAEKTLKTNEKNIKALEDANKSKTELLKTQKELLKKGIELTKEDKKRLETAEKIIALKSKEISSDKNKIKDAKDLLKTQEKATKEKEKAEKAEKALLDKEKERQKNLRKIIVDTEELDSLTGSITSNTQKYGKEFVKTLPNVKNIKNTLSSVATIITSLPESQKGLSRQAQVTTESYKNLNTSIISSKKELTDNTITQEEFNKTIVGSYKEFDKLISKIDTSTKEGKELVKIYTEQKDKLGEQVDIQKVMSDYEKDRITGIKELNSQFNRSNLQYEKFSDLAELAQTRQDTIEGSLTSISKIISTIPDEQEELKNQATATAAAYVNLETTIVSAKKELQDGKITLEEYNKLVTDSNEAFEKQVGLINTSTQAGKALVQTFQDAKSTSEEFVDAADKSKKKLETLGTAMDQLGSSGIPLMSELSNVTQQWANGGLKAAKVGLIALGAAMAGLAAKYFLAGPQVEIEMYNQRLQNAIDLKRQLGEIEVEFGTSVPGEGGKKFNVVQERAAVERGEIDLDYAKKTREVEVDKQFVAKELTNELSKKRLDDAEEIRQLENDARFAAERAANAFSASMKSAAAEFRAASKTALFGNKLGSVGYGAAQLQMAGISADKIAGAMSAASAATGKMPTGKAAADMSILAERTGTSVDNIASINSMFQRTEGVTTEVAMNLTEGMRALADNAGISLGNLMQEVADASKDALGYQIKSGKALAKQVAYAQSMGVNFGDIAKAGKSMVLNYKDSIKAEMQLSTLLGEQVDLSEVRAKFAEGDTAGALDALKAQGLNPEDMDMFQQEALSQALGGMDLSSLQKIATKTGTTAELGAGKAGAANQDFLKRNVAAQQQLSAEQAQISAQQAIIDAKTSQKVMESFLTDPAMITARQKALDLQLEEAKTEADKQKAKINALTDPAFVQMQANQKIMQANFDTLIKNLQTYNKKILDAAAEQKQLDVSKGFTENLISGGAALLGGVGTNMLTNALEKKFKGGAGGGKPGGKPGSKPGGKPKARGGKKPRGMAASGGGGFGRGLKGAAIGVGLSLLAPTIANAFSGGQEEVAAETENVTESVNQMSDNVSNQFTTASDASASAICNCLGGLREQMMAALKEQNEVLKDQLYSSKDYWKDNAAFMKAQQTGMILQTTMYEGIEAATRGATNLAKKGVEKVVGKKVGQEVLETGAREVVETGGREAAESAGKTGLAKVSEKLGITALKKTGGEVIEGVAKTAIGKVATNTLAKVGTSMAGKIAMKATSGPLGVVTGVIGGLAQVYGDYKKDEAVATGNLAALTEGRIADTVGTALEYAGYGAMIGSFIPGIGTAVGGAVGAVIGGAVGIWNNWFSAEAQEMQRVAEREANQQAALQQLIAINQSVDSTMERSFAIAERTGEIADDEVAWRDAVLQQLIETTRLTEQNLWKGSTGMQMIGGKVVNREFEGSYDKTKGVMAKRFGKAEALSAREQNILNASMGNTGANKNSKGEQMNFAEYKENFNVTEQELAKIREKQTLLAVAQSRQNEMAVTAATTAKPTTATTATATKGTTATGTTTATTTNAAATPAPATTPAVSLATEATQKLIQTQADTRGILMYGLMQTMNTNLNSLITWVGMGYNNQFSLMNTTLTGISTKMDSMVGTGQSSTTDSILTMIQQEANARGIAMYSLMQMMNISLNNMVSKAITAPNPLENAANNASIQTAKINSNIAKNEYVTATNSQKLNDKVANLSNQAAQLVQVNKNLQSLLDAFLTNNQNDGQIRLLIDGKQVTRVIKRREDNSAGQSTTGGDDD